jgi:hypothetical protein
MEYLFTLVFFIILAHIAIFVILFMIKNFNKKHLLYYCMFLENGNVAETMRKYKMDKLVEDKLDSIDSKLDK